MARGYRNAPIGVPFKNVVLLVLYSVHNSSFLLHQIIEDDCWSHGGPT